MPEAYMSIHSLLQRTLDSRLKRLGVPCSAVIDGEVVDFYGIFAVVTTFEDSTSNLQVAVPQTTLTVRTSLAKKFSQNHVITVNDARWYLRDGAELVDDGSLTRCIIAEK